MIATKIFKYFYSGHNPGTVVKFFMAKKKDYRPKGPVQILAAVGLVIAILWTAKGFFEFGKAGYKEINSSQPNTKTETAVIIDLNCRWLSGETFIDGTRLPFTSGIPGTHDIVISLMPSKNKLIKFEVFSGNRANVKTFNQNEIVWDANMGSDTWAYRLSRLSGSLKTDFTQGSTGGRMFSSYQCSKSEQKF